MAAVAAAGNSSLEASETSSSSSITMISETRVVRLESFEGDLDDNRDNPAPSPFWDDVLCLKNVSMFVWDVSVVLIRFLGLSEP
jgi:hypothetical protein